MKKVIAIMILFCMFAWIADAKYRSSYSRSSSSYKSTSSSTYKSKPSYNTNYKSTTTTPKTTTTKSTTSTTPKSTTTTTSKTTSTTTSPKSTTTKSTYISHREVRYSSNTDSSGNPFLMWLGGSVVGTIGTYLIMDALMDNQTLGNMVNDGQAQYQEVLNEAGELVWYQKIGELDPNADTATEVSAEELTAKAAANNAVEEKEDNSIPWGWIIFFGLILGWWLFAAGRSSGNWRYDY